MSKSVFAVVGKPVLHDRRPAMYAAAFAQLAIDAVYVRLAAEDAAEALVTAKAAGMRGLNVTASFQREMARLVEAGDEGAARLGAVNTVVFEGSTPRGYHADEARAFALLTGREAPLAVMHRARRDGSRRRKENIALIGFMGSGKDACAGKLAKQSGMDIIHMDAAIEQQAGTSVREIFEREGEQGFRKREGAIVAAVARKRGKIINCGGGAVLAAENREALRRRAVVVWLFADLQTTLTRVPKDGARPLLDAPDPRAAAARLLARRLPLYAAASDLMIDTGRMTPGQVSERICYEVHTVFPHLR